MSIIRQPVLSHVQKLSSDIQIAGDAEFVLVPLYLHYFENGNNRGFGNKAIILRIIESISEAIESDSGYENHFIFFLHGHGDSDGENELDSFVVIDNYPNCEEANKLLKGEIYKSIRPILAKCDCYLILNSCKSAPGPNERTLDKKNIFCKKFSEYDAFTNLTVDYKLYSLGMSSDVVYKDRFDKMSYGIKILKGIMELGMKQDIIQVFNNFSNVLSTLNKNNGNLFYLPKLYIVSKEKGSPNKGLKPPFVTSDTYLKWNENSLRPNV